MKLKTSLGRAWNWPSRGWRWFWHAPQSKPRPVHPRQAELDAALAHHQLWLDTRGEQGGRLAVRGDTFAGAEFHGACLDNADFSGACLDRAVLDLCSFKDVALAGTSLLDTSLVGADLSGAKGLLARQLAGADLRGARVPASVKEFPLIAVAKNAAESAQKVSLGLLAGCLYCWLTIAATTDASLITNSGSTQLPFVGVSIPAGTFYVVPPALLLGVFGYLHLYLVRLWEALAFLPAYFPNGQSLDQQSSARLLTEMLRRLVVRLRPERVRFARLRTWLPRLLAWWMVPATMLLFWQRYLASHDWGFSGIQGFLAGGAFSLAFASYRAMRSAFRRTDPPRRSLAGRLGRLALATAGVTGFAYGLMILAALGLAVLPERAANFEYQGPEGYVGSRQWADEEAPLICKIALATLSFGRNHLVADLRGEHLSRAPEGWTATEDPGLAKVTGVNLSGRDLTGANLRGTFLARADMRGADLKAADLARADLRQAFIGWFRQGSQGWGLIVRPNDIMFGWSRWDSVSSASLSGASLLQADLREPLLVGVFLTDTDLLLADLRGTTLSDCQLNQTSFIGADLRGVKITGQFGPHAALFFGARLEETDQSQLQGLETADVVFSTFDEKTRFPEKFVRPERCYLSLSPIDAVVLSQLVFATESNRTSSRNGGESSRAAEPATSPRYRAFASAQTVAVKFFADRPFRPPGLEGNGGPTH